MNVAFVLLWSCIFFFFPMFLSRQKSYVAFGGVLLWWAYSDVFFPSPTERQLSSLIKIVCNNICYATIILMFFFLRVIFVCIDS